MVNKLSLLLSRIYLGGILKECVLRVKKRRYSIQAVDMTNSIFISCSFKSKNKDKSFLEDRAYGIGDLGLLCKYLDSIDTEDEKTELNIKRAKNRLIFNKGKRNSLRYLLTDPEVIPTDISQKNAVSKLEDTCKYRIQLKEVTKKDYLFYINLTGLNVVNLEISRGRAFLSAGTEGDHQFSISLGKLSHIKDKSKKVTKEFSISLYSEYLSAILQQLTWDNKKSMPEMKMSSANKPVIIEQDSNNIWALFPVTSGEK